MAKLSDSARFASMRSPSSWVRFVAPQLLLGGAGLIVGLVLGVVVGLAYLSDGGGILGGGGSGTVPVARAGGPAALFIFAVLALVAALQLLFAIAPPIVFAFLGLCVGVVAASVWDLIRLWGKAGRDSLWRAKLWSAIGTVGLGGLGIFASTQSAAGSDLVSAGVIFVAYGVVGGIAGGVLGLLVVWWASRG